MGWMEALYFSFPCYAIYSYSNTTCQCFQFTFYSRISLNYYMTDTMDKGYDYEIHWNVPIKINSRIALLKTSPSKNSHQASETTLLYEVLHSHLDSPHSALLDQKKLVRYYN